MYLQTWVVGAINEVISKAFEGLGSVHFETSCSDSVASSFDKAVALLHSFWYEEALKIFQNISATDKDGTCPMADWVFHPLLSRFCICVVAYEK